MTPDDFVRALAGVDCAHTFNPYSDRCAIHDRADAPVIRRRNLFQILRAARGRRVDAVWMGRDLGFRGGRRTGLALTDDLHLPIHGRLWGVSCARPTKGELVAERTATVVWELLTRVDVPVFLWNAFPFHPYNAGQPFSNRAHKGREREIGTAILRELIALLRPRRLVAVGNDATRTAGLVGNAVETLSVRHPSYGGQRQFRAKICQLYGLSESVPGLGFREDA